MAGSKIKSLKRVCQIIRPLQKKGQKVIFCHGFFDILHKGHVTLLVRAKNLGDILVVGVDHDDNARRLKGPNRPINDHWSRMFILAQLEVVDYVFLIPSFRKLRSSEKLFKFYVEEIYSELMPNVVATCLKAGNFGHLKKKQAEELGIGFADINHGIYDKKTSKIIRLLEKGSK